MQPRFSAGPLVHLYPLVLYACARHVPSGAYPALRPLFPSVLFATATATATRNPSLNAKEACGTRRPRRVRAEGTTAAARLTAPTPTPRRPRVRPAGVHTSQAECFVIAHSSRSGWPHTKHPHSCASCQQREIIRSATAKAAAIDESNHARLRCRQPTELHKSVS